MIITNIAGQSGCADEHLHGRGRDRGTVRHTCERRITRQSRGIYAQDAGRFPRTAGANTGNGGIAITNAALGKFQINIADTASAGLPVGGYPYDLWMISGGGAATRLLAGTFTVAQNIAAIP